jgi:hypothetical protein
MGDLLLLSGTKSVAGLFEKTAGRFRLRALAAAAALGLDERQQAAVEDYA